MRTPILIYHLKVIADDSALKAALSELDSYPLSWTLSNLIFEK